LKGINTWSYRPYTPFLWNVGDPYICRIVPTMDSVSLYWLETEGDESYKIVYRKRGEEAFLPAGETKACSFTVENLVTDTDYEFQVSHGEKHSRIRLARTGESVGTVVNYLHPEDNCYSFSGHALCSPSLLKLDDGTYLSSMDVFSGDYPQNLTLVFRSADGGKTWEYVTELMPCFWGKLFRHKGDIYMLSCSTEYGDLLIGKSTDGGRTFCTPTVLLRGANGKHGSSGVHKNPQNIVCHNGRLYETLEWGSWGNAEYCHAAMVMSIDENADLMNAENWHFSAPLKYDPTWEGVAQGEARGNIEGTLAVAPNGKLYNVMRYNIGNAVPSWGLVLAYEVNENDPDAPLTYSHAIALPGNNSKFMIKKDEVSGKYFTIISRILGEEHKGDRNLLSLMQSDDMEHWDLVCDLLDFRDRDPKQVGFQYVDFMFEGNDLIFLCRTALNHARNFHDANYQTFHRVENFRSLLK